MFQCLELLQKIKYALKMHSIDFQDSLSSAKFQKLG